MGSTGVLMAMGDGSFVLARCFRLYWSFLIAMVHMA